VRPGNSQGSNKVVSGGPWNLYSQPVPFQGRFIPIPQKVAFVEVSNEELGVVEETDPTGEMMISARMVEVSREDETAVRRAKIGEYVNSLSMKDQAFLAAMADKRGRAEQAGGDMLAQEAPKAQKKRTERSGRAQMPSQGVEQQTPHYQASLQS